jgi:hypothetical protein
MSRMGSGRESKVIADRGAGALARPSRAPGIPSSRRRGIDLVKSVARYAGSYPWWRQFPRLKAGARISRRLTAA